MAGYRLLFKRSVSRDLRSLPKKDVTRILQRIEALDDDPRPPGCEKLSAKEYYRIRQGMYRIIYSVSDDEACVMIIRVAHRKDFYQRGDQGLFVNQGER